MLSKNSHLNDSMNLGPGRTFLKGRIILLGGGRDIHPFFLDIYVSGYLVHKHIFNIFQFPTSLIFYTFTAFCYVAS